MRSMVKVGQNITVGYPDRHGPQIAGVVHDIARVNPNRELCWVRVESKMWGMVKEAFPYPMADVSPLVPTPENPEPEHFSVGNRVSILGERWEITAFKNKTPEVEYLVIHTSGLTKEVTAADFA
jgi:hypothetical protein